MRKYYTLAVRENGVWGAQFGDYDKETVEDERADYLDHDHKARDLKVIKSGDGRVAIEAAIAKLNGATNGKG